MNKAQSPQAFGGRKDRTDWKSKPVAMLKKVGMGRYLRARLGKHLEISVCGRRITSYSDPSGKLSWQQLGEQIVAVMEEIGCTILDKRDLGTYCIDFEWPGEGGAVDQNPH